MKLSSVVLVAVSLAFVCVNGQKGGALQDLVKKCGEKSSMDMDAMKRSFAGDNADGKLSCPVECICKAIGVMNADGGPNEAVADKLLAKVPEASKAMVKGCMKSMKAGASNCQSGGDFAKCIIPKLPQMQGQQ